MRPLAPFLGLVLLALAGCSSEARGAAVVAEAEPTATFKTERWNPDWAALAISYLPAAQRDALVSSVGASPPAHDIVARTVEPRRLEVVFASSQVSPAQVDQPASDDPLLALSPPVAGRWRWLTTRAVEFVPDQPFEDSQTLPLLVNGRPVSPWPVGGLRIVSAAWDSNPTRRALTVTLSRALRSDSPPGLIEARVSGGVLKTTRGTPRSAEQVVLLFPELPESAELSLQLETAYGDPAPFAVQTPQPLSCLTPEFSPENGLEFSQPLDPASVVQALRLIPDVGLTAAHLVVEGATLRLVGLRLVEGTEYTLTVNPSVKDIWGRELGKRLRFDFVAPATAQWSRFPAQGTAYLAKGSPLRIDWQGLNLTGIAQLLQKSSEPWRRPEGNPKPLDPAPLADNFPWSRTVNFAPLIGPEGTGWVEMAWTVPGDPWLSLQVTDLAAAVRSGPGKTVVWVTNLSLGRPVAGARVSLAGKSASTNAQGLAVLPVGVGDLGRSEVARVLVEKGSDRLLVVPDTPQEIIPSALVLTDRTSYSPGASLLFRAWDPVRSGPWRVQLVNAHSVGTVSANGSASGALTLPLTLPPGRYPLEYQRPSGVSGAWSTIATTEIGVGLVPSEKAPERAWDAVPEVEAGRPHSLTLTETVPAGASLVTVEGATILDQWVVESDKPVSSLDWVPLAAYAPGVVVRVTSLSGTQSRLVRVLPRSTGLDLVLDVPRLTVIPGKTVPVTVTAFSKGKPVAGAEITLMAVDRDAGSLPDPLGWLTYRTWGGLAGGDTRTRLLGNTAGESAPFDVPFGFAGPPSYSSTAVFLPALVTDASGQVQLNLALPPSTSGYRLLAFGALKDKQGQTAATVRTGFPVVLSAVVPPALRLRDTLFAGVLVTNRDPVPHTVQVSVTSDVLTVGGKGERHVAVNPGQTLEVAFELAALRRGEGTVLFHLVQDGVVQNLERAVTVNGSSPVNETIVGKLTEPSSVQFLPVQGTVAGLVVHAGSSPLVLVAPWLEKYGITSLPDLEPTARLKGAPLKAALRPASLTASTAEVLARLVDQLRREKASATSLAPVVAALENRLLHGPLLSRQQTLVVAKVLDDSATKQTIPGFLQVTLDKVAAASSSTLAGDKLAFVVPSEAVTDSKLSVQLEKAGKEPGYFAAVVTSEAPAEQTVPLAFELEITGRVLGTDGLPLTKDELLTGTTYQLEVVVSSPVNRGPAVVTAFLPSGVRGETERKFSLEGIPAGTVKFSVPFEAAVQGAFPTPGPSVELIDEPDKANDLGHLYVILHP